MSLAQFYVPLTRVDASLLSVSHPPSNGHLGSHWAQNLAGNLLSGLLLEFRHGLLWSPISILQKPAIAELVGVMKFGQRLACVYC